MEAYNPYRFNSKRWDPATGSYDMGFRDYSPGLNRFLTRDTYNGALADLRLGSDPWTGNRYAFAGGNPIAGIEYDGHCPMAEEGGGCARTDEPTGSQTPQSRISSARRPADPIVRDKFGVQPVVARDRQSYERAYTAAAEKLVGTGGGQGPELAAACTDMDQHVAGGGTELRCGVAYTTFATLFGAEMCRQPGMLCTAPPDTRGTVAMAAFAIGLGKDGGRASGGVGGSSRAAVGEAVPVRRIHPC